jgi:hypothetical protein
MLAQKKIQISFFFLFLLIFALGANFVSAQQLEIQYPSLPFQGVETPQEFLPRIKAQGTPEQALALYIKYFYSLILVLSGIIAFGTILYAGFLYLVSAGDPLKLLAAKQQVIAGFVGIILIFSSYIILTTINPQFALFYIKAPPIEKCDCEKPEAELSQYCQAFCQKFPEQTEESPSYVEIPVGRLTEWVIKRADEAKVLANQAKTVSQNLAALTKQLEEATKQCSCQNTCPTGLEEFGQELEPLSGDGFCTGQDACPSSNACVGGLEIRPVSGQTLPPKGSLSKLGIQTAYFPGEIWSFIDEAQPAVVKLLGNYGSAGEIKMRSPGTFVVGRVHEPQSWEQRTGDPKVRAQEWFQRNRDKIISSPNIDCWEGYNEPVPQNSSEMSWYADFESERIKLLAQVGAKACIGTFSVGQPDDLNLWPSFFPAIETALQYGGYLNLHEYDAPTMTASFDFSSEEGWRTGRYRKVYNQYLIPNNLKIPLIISEAGIDGGVIGERGRGWKSYEDAQAYLEDLKWYDSLLREDDYVIGAAIFGWGMYGWDDFEITPELAQLLTEYINRPHLEYVSGPCDPCQNRTQILSLQRQIIRTSSQLQSIRERLKRARLNLNQAKFKLELAENLLNRGLFASTFPPVSFQEFAGLQTDSGAKKIKLPLWQQIDIADNPLTLGYDNIDDPATFYLPKKGNEEFMAVVENLTFSGSLAEPPSIEPQLPPIQMPPPTGTVYQNFAEKTRSFAISPFQTTLFPTSFNHKLYIKADPTGYYKSSATNYGADCGIYVATVVRNTIDKNYPKAGSPIQQKYLENHPDFDCFVVQSTADLKAGDILFSYPKNEFGGEGHTAIWLEDGTWQASLNSYLPTGPAPWNPRMRYVCRYKKFNE